MRTVGATISALLNFLSIGGRVVLTGCLSVTPAPGSPAATVVGLSDVSVVGFSSATVVAVSTMVPGDQTGEYYKAGGLVTTVIG